VTLAPALLQHVELAADIGQIEGEPRAALSAWLLGRSALADSCRRACEGEDWLGECLDECLRIAPSDSGSTLLQLAAANWERQISMLPPPNVRMTPTALRDVLTLLKARAGEIAVVDSYAASTKYSDAVRRAWQAFGVALFQSTDAGTLHVACLVGAKDVESSIAGAENAIRSGLACAQGVVKDGGQPPLVAAFGKRRREAGHERFMAVFDRDEAAAHEPRWVFWLGKGIQSLIASKRKVTTVGLVAPTLWSGIWESVTAQPWETYYRQAEQQRRTSARATLTGGAQ
jgi:hypothetical protein